jgi:hypothetical protein
MNCPTIEAGVMTATREFCVSFPIENAPITVKVHVYMKMQYNKGLMVSGAIITMVTLQG